MQSPIVGLHPASVVVLCLQTFDNLLLLRIASRLSRIANASFHPSLHPLAGRDTSRQLSVLVCAVPQPFEQRTIYGLELEIALRPDKVENAQTVLIGLVRRRRHDTMNRALEESTRHKLQCICRIDRDASIVWLNPFPTAVRPAYLESCNRLAKEERQASVVGVAFEPHISYLGICVRIASVVLHVPQVAVRHGFVAMALHKVVFWQL